VSDDRHPDFDQLIAGAGHEPEPPIENFRRRYLAFAAHEPGPLVDHAEHDEDCPFHPTAAELQTEQRVKLNPAYEKLLQDVSRDQEPEPSAISDSDLGDMPETVNHPAHYGGADNPHEVIKCLEAWGLDRDAYLFNVGKYIARPTKGDYLEDLKKARFYLNRKIARMEGS
jgi:hypothetical protein